MVLSVIFHDVIDYKNPPKGGGCDNRETEVLLTEYFIFIGFGGLTSRSTLKKPVIAAVNGLSLSFASASSQLRSSLSFSSPLFVLVAYVSCPLYLSPIARTSLLCVSPLFLNC